MPAVPIKYAQDFQRIPVIGFVPESTSTPPSSPVAGLMYLDTNVTPNRVMIYENGGWVYATRTGAELTANKGAASGYASLDSGTKVPIAQIPTGTSSTTVLLGNTRLDQIAAPTADVDFNTRKITGIAAPTNNQDATNKVYVLGRSLSEFAAPTAALAMGSQRITGLAASTGATDAVNRGELDAARQGFAGAKDPVDAVATSNINVVSAPATIDGVSPGAGKSVLLTAQTTGTVNGIYTYTAAGAGMVRRTDADATGEIQDGTTVGVGSGTAAGSIYIQTATPSGAPGSWTQVWTVFQPAGTAYTAGDGLVLTGNDFNVVAADGSITVGANSITVGNVPVAKGGTGGTDAATGRAGLGATGKYIETLGALVAGVETTVTHNLGTTEFTYSTRDGSTDYPVGLIVRPLTSSTAGVTAHVAVASGTKIVIIG